MFYPRFKPGDPDEQNETVRVQYCFVRYPGDLRMALRGVEGHAGQDGDRLFFDYS
jgi:hypothetical protein